MVTSRFKRLALVGFLATGLAGCDGGPRRAVTPATPHTPPTGRGDTAELAKWDIEDGAAAGGGGRKIGVLAGGERQPATRTLDAAAAPKPAPGIGGGGIGGGGIGGGIGGMPGGPAPGQFGRGVDVQRLPFRAGALKDRGGYDGQHQEQYRHVQDNAFRPVSREPVSTFSADVNTAGYTNVRRFLGEGKLPPPDAVRTAELLNFFPFRYPAPTGDAPVAFALAAMPCPWQPTHHLVRIGLQARQIDPAHAPPRNFVFLIDTSGSMFQPTRLPLVQRSLGMLIDQLTANDVVTVVTYAGSAGLKLPPTRGDQKARIRAVVDGLSAGGSTDGAGGIALAYEQARANFLAGGCNRVILCTDGDFNVGVTAEGELVRLIEKERAGNVFLTVLGYGMGNLKDATLESLARHGNGHYAYIDSDAEARKVFVEQGGALTAVAKDVKLQVEFNPAVVAAYRLIGYENRLLNTEDFKDDKKDAGDLGSGHTVTVLYEVVPATAPPVVADAEPLKYQPAVKPATGGSTEWLTAKMRYKHPESATSQEVSAALTADAAGKPADVDFRFAVAVAEFALILRDAKDKGTANYDRVLAGAGNAIGPDPFGHRTQFVELVKQARRLTGVQREDASR